MADQEIGDPWSDPLPALRNIDEEMQRNQAVGEFQQRMIDQYELLWKNAISMTRTGGNLSSLGAELKRRGHKFWLDTWLLILRRAHKASRRPRFRTEDLLRAEAIRLLSASMDCDEQAMESALTRTYEVAVPYALVGPLTETKHFIGLWSDPNEYPHTPHLTRQELVRATRDMDGMSEPSICRKLKSGMITVDEPKGSLVRFRHLRSTVHLEMLRAVVNFLAES
jgi:hypothetical protein